MKSISALVLVTAAVLRLATFAQAADTLPPCSRIAAADTATVWMPWEQTLTSGHEYANPYREVMLRVVFDGPQGRSFGGYGFWDGDRLFKLRAAFPAAGAWSWRTTCSDITNPGLHGRSGAVTVAPYAGANSLHRHGYLKVSDNHRYLVYADGVPFLWIGDTPWAAFIAATQEEWENYIRNRKSNKFTILQVHCGGAWPAVLLLRALQRATPAAPSAGPLCDKIQGAGPG